MRDEQRMGQLADHWKATLCVTDPYADFPHQEYTLELQGGQEHSLFQQLITHLQPRVIVEVGSWKGDSALRMAKLLKEQQIDGAILCVDTWLGSLEHVTGTVQGWDIRPYLKQGYPTLYHQFIANVLHCGHADLIIPIPNTSVNAARFLLRHALVADLIFIDASHEEDDVYQDLCCFWKLLRPGGLMFGDDWHSFWFGVICAVNRFSRENELRLQVTEDKWVLQKPAA